MPQVKIHSPRVEENTKKELLLEEIRETIVKTLAVDEKVGQVLLCETEPGNRKTHEDRDGRFVFIEITMYAGRKKEMKQRLMGSMVEIVKKHLGVDTNDIICCIYEVEPENYFGEIRHPYIDEIEKKNKQ